MFYYNLLRNNSIIFSIGTISLYYSSTLCEIDKNININYEKQQILTNWSSTHTRTISRLYEPKNERELERLLRYYQSKKQQIRPIGTCLSPNGISLPDSNGVAVSLHHFNNINVNPIQKIVTVGAGATVADVLKELSKFGLTLENFSSIQEQQIAGWTQVAAHGTGCTLPTVEEQIIEMKIVSPNEGLLLLSNQSLPNIFRFAKVGLGSLGVVTELKMKCIPQLSLKEETAVYNRHNINNQHYDRLNNFRHVRYMWIPYTPTVVSVVSNPIENTSPSSSLSLSQVNLNDNQLPTQSLINLIKTDQNTSSKLSNEYLSQQGFGTLRDLALGINPLDLNHVIQVNKAESEFWKNAQGVRIDDSTNILGFDCGGEQFVMEICFPMGQLDDKNYKDINFVKELLQLVESKGIAAPGPIEQRWTARSTSPMSPAYSDNPSDIFCWVGIIMYMPLNQTPEQREIIKQQFQNYCNELSPLIKKYDGQLHWGKIELFLTDEIKQQIHKKYPIQEFQQLKTALDPEGILSNSLIKNLLN